MQTKIIVNGKQVQSPLLRCLIGATAIVLAAIALGGAIALILGIFGDRSYPHRRAYPIGFLGYAIQEAMTVVAERIVAEKADACGLAHAVEAMA